MHHKHTNTVITYNVTVSVFAVHLLAIDYIIVTTNCITLPYKIVYLDSKTVTATMHCSN